MFEWLDLVWDLPTGVRIRLGNYGDWVVYNEIFVSGEYDEALTIAMTSRAAADRPLRVVDLGANTGWFTLRAVDRLRRHGVADGDVSVTAVEGSSWCVGEFSKRIFRENDLSRNVTLVHGLIGERSGVGTLYEDEVHVASSSVLRAAGAPPSDQVPYVDLSPLLAASPCIDLLKCDIEGSEQLFIENYRDVLQKTRVAVFEFHRDLCDVDRCLALLRDYGFVHQATFRQGDPYFCLGVWR